MTAALLPATATLQGAEGARPGTRPEGPSPRGEDAFAARLARAQADARPQTAVRAPAPADASGAGESAAPGADSAPVEADEAPGIAAELLAVIAFAPPAVATAAAAKVKDAAGLALDGAAYRAGPEVTDAAGALTAPPSPAAVGVPTQHASEAAATLLDNARADAALRDETQSALPALPAGTDTGIAGGASAQPATVATAAAAPTPLATAHAAAQSLHIAAVVDTPAFAPTLAHQIGWLVREGLSLASLHLNPPELGPVSVQIVVEGRHARIDFGAEMALTRSAIEDSLPRLASAMQEIGLTLSGGGVFDGRPRRDAPAPLAERGTAVDDGARSAGTSGFGVTVRQAPRGLVDLVA